MNYGDFLLLSFPQVVNGQGDDPSDPIALHDMECEGGERHIEECRFQDHAAHFCAGTEKAGLTCRRTARRCEGHEFHCDNKECVHANNLCDGAPQCADGSDEAEERCRAPLQVRKFANLFQESPLQVRKFANLSPESPLQSCIVPKS